MVNDSSRTVKPSCYTQYTVIDIVMLVEDSQSLSAWHFDMSSYRNHLVTCSQASPLLRMI